MNNKAINTTIFGGFIPGYALSKLAEAVFKPEDVTTVPKTPILYDPFDAKYLIQFPNTFQNAALQYRYNNLPFILDKIVKEGKDIPNFLNVELPSSGRGGIRTFKVNVYGKQLYDKLTKPRDLEKFSTEDADKLRSSYDGGHYGFDFSNEMSHSDIDNNIDVRKSNNYIGMSKMLSMGSIKDWRDGLIKGFLARPKEVIWKPVSFGGGKGKKEYFIDWNGNVQLRSGSEILLPVWHPDIIRDWFGADKIAADGKVKFSDNEKENGYVIAYGSGKFVPNIIVNAHKELQTKLNNLINDGKSADHVIEELMKLKDGFVKNPDGEEIQVQPQYDIFDWQVRRYNPSQEQRIHTNMGTFGGADPMRAEKEQIAGTSKDWETIKKHIAGEGGPDKVTSPEGSNMLNAVERGVSRVIKSFYEKAPSVAKVLGTLKDDIISQAHLHVMGLIGDPLYAKYAKIARGEEDVPTQWQNLIKDKSGNMSSTEKLNKYLYENIANKAANFTIEVSQLDLGQGTRRLRLRQRVEELNRKIGSEGGEAGMNVSGDQKNIRLGMRGQLGDVEKRRRGERTAVRKSPTMVSGEIVFGSSLENISNKIRELKNIQQEKHNLENQMKNSIDQAQEGKPKTIETVKIGKQSVEMLKNDVSIRNMIYQEALDAYMAYQIVNNNIDFTMEEANKFALDYLQNSLRQAGIKTTDVADEGVSGKQAQIMDNQKKEFIDALSKERAAIEKTIPKTIDVGGENTQTIVIRLSNDPQALMKIQKQIDNATSDEQEHYWTDIKNRVMRYQQLHSPQFTAQVKTDPKVMDALIKQMRNTPNQEEQKELLYYINNIRKELGVPPVGPDVGVEVGKQLAGKYA